MPYKRSVKCEFASVMVSYIYDEIEASERRVLEGHLIDCSACTDEFAALSNARFSVYEWQKEEFADMPTPIFTVPGAGEARTVEPGFLAGVRSFIASLASPVPIAIAASLLITAALGFVLLRSSVEEPMVANVAAPELTSPSRVNQPAELAPQPPSTQPSIQTAERSPQPVGPNVDRVAEPGRSARPNRAVAKGRAARPLAAQTAGSAKPSTKKAPTLSDFNETNDKSLRLTDLFAEIGSGRE